MVFASAVFLYYFLPIFLGLYYLSPKKGRAWVIAFASYLFYGWWRPDFVSLMLISTLVDFHCGKWIVRDRARGRPIKRWLLVSLFVNLGLLAYFKYANFGIETLNAALGAFGVSDVQWTHVVLPVGISFYTFQTLSYTIDVYRGTSEPVRNFRDFACYVAMFPQLVAGPIVRYNTIADQLHTRSHTIDKFYRGVLSFQSGFAKKVLVADILGQVADNAFATDGLGVLDAWIGVAAYTFQIYFDFSGYCDMAIGLGLMMGFRFPINFDQPYRSRSITEFWRRWHISLSAFLRDYLYIPLGGNRKGPVRTYVNLALTMLLGGLWHGASWTFVAWGAYQGFWLIVERLAGKRSLYGNSPRVVQMAATFVLVMFGWVLFRAESIGDAWHYLGSLLWVGAGDNAVQLRPLHVIAGVVAIALVWGARTTQRQIERPRLGWVVPLQLAFLLALVHLHYQDQVPFLYFQF